jgi:hypothetical protein
MEDELNSIIKYMEVVMRKTYIALLVLFSCVSAFAQIDTLKSPISNTAVTTTKPTFKWKQNPLAVNGYEICMFSTLGDTSTALPLAADVGKWKRYVVAGTHVTDTSFTLDTLLAKSTATRYWKVRPKLASGFGAWVFANGKFTMALPAYSVTDAGNAVIKFNHDTLSAVSGITFLNGSKKQILDTTQYAKYYGLGATGTTRDTLITWDQTAGKYVYTYQNATKYGKTGSKILTVSYGATGVTVDDSLTLETAKTVALNSALRPGGDFANDKVIFVKSAPVRTTLTYPSSIASIGPDSLTLSAFYDSNYNE